MSPAPNPLCVLFDNGSLRAASTLRLREIARQLSQRIGEPVQPVSLLHSDKISPGELEGTSAEILEPFLEAQARLGRKAFLLLPLFFGPSGAFVEYLPKRLLSLREKYTGFRATIARPLIERDHCEDDRVARILAEGVRAVMTARHLIRPAVVVVDHGSPQRAVTAVRERVGDQLRTLLGDAVRGLVTASMERRPEPEYDFNEPLLERALRTAGFDAGDVVIAQLFLSPGRHAGSGGDIETICQESEAAQPSLKTWRTPLVGEGPRLLDILVDRWREALARAGETQ